MSTKDWSHLNMFELLRAKIERTVKWQITEDIVSKLMAGVEDEIRAKLKPIVEGISIPEIAKMVDGTAVRDEFTVYVEMREKQHEPT